MTLDKMIADEILNTIDEKIAQYSENTKRHRFSLAYKIQRIRIIKNANKPAKRLYRYPLRRV